MPKICTAITSSILAAVLISGNVAQAKQLPLCGHVYAPPFYEGPHIGSRICPPSTQRNYTPKYRGIAKRALDLESEACFVPDAAYELLDEIVDSVRKRLNDRGVRPGRHPSRELVVIISEVTGSVLAGMGFSLAIPTNTLGDALQAVNPRGEPPVYRMDCDISSLILLEVAESYGLPAGWVDITLPSGEGHTYVRWVLDDGDFLDWDTNGRAPCKTPANTPPFEGRLLSRDESVAYLLTIRAGLWRDQQRYPEAISDYNDAIRLDPKRFMAHNNLAWMISTRDFPSRSDQKHIAILSSLRAAISNEKALYYDTLACSFAFNGQFKEAVIAQEKAVALEPSSLEYRERLEMFRATPPQDCTGADADADARR